MAEELAGSLEVTVGTMLGTFMHVECTVDIETPSWSHGGNVWQHLRTFRKHLLDTVSDHVLRIDERYCDIAVDWSCMLFLVEWARLQLLVQESIYMYEPSGFGKSPDRQARESHISAIMAKTPPVLHSPWTPHH